VLRGYKKDEGDRLSFKTPASRDMSLGAEKLNWQLQNNGKKEITL
jgi:hypothetical protein